MKARSELILAVALAVAGPPTETLVRPSHGKVAEYQARDAFPVIAPPELAGVLCAADSCILRDCSESNLAVTLPGNDE